MALSKPSDRVDQEDFSNSDKVLTGGRRPKKATGPSILKLLATGTTEIDTVRSGGKVVASSSK